MGMGKSERAHVQPLQVVGADGPDGDLSGQAQTGHEDGDQKSDDGHHRQEFD